ncbi:uncharacterized protein PpBr36_06589 [Pyricularia pennisetigena]|uniref:uncharacterized protein n=1 Tax=Pyricularia pennisetigena TaxID=1578925 RepID=UPI00115050FC|nr:uncharacterized protein PpBr36_06589 [Pyricularia pennisetigena]TLS23586.1 hypothetical protein PpBr36_06589 [Pyricularia pennisetigena]
MPGRKTEAKEGEGEQKSEYAEITSVRGEERRVGGIRSMQTARRRRAAIDRDETGGVERGGGTDWRHSPPRIGSKCALAGIFGRQAQGTGADAVYYVQGQVQGKWGVGSAEKSG